MATLLTFALGLLAVLTAEAANTSSRALASTSFSSSSLSPAPPSHGPLTLAFLTALSAPPALLDPSHPARPRLLPDASSLIEELLSEQHLTLAAGHWQGGNSSLQSCLGLLRAGRDTLLPALGRTAAAATPAQGATDTGPGDGEADAVGDGAGALAAWMTQAEDVVAAAQPGPSYPLLRRGVTAVLARVWAAAKAEAEAGKEAAVADRVAGRVWTQAMDERAAALVLRLHSLHTASAAAKSALEFIHISKAGGTSFCTTAGAEGCTTFSTGDQWTCLLPSFNDAPRWMKRAAHRRRCKKALPQLADCEDRVYTTLARWGLRYSPRAPHYSCAARAAALAARGWNMFASEYTLRSTVAATAKGGKGGGMGAEEAAALCPQFFNVAIFRPPLPRLLSHMRHVAAASADKLGPHAPAYWANASWAEWRGLLPAALDNYATRTFLGEAGFYVPTGSLLPGRHLPPARAAVGALDAVLLLGDLHAAGTASKGAGRAGAGAALRGAAGGGGGGEGAGGGAGELALRWGLGWGRGAMQAEGRASSALREEAAEVAGQALDAVLRSLPADTGNATPSSPAAADPHAASSLSHGGQPQPPPPPALRQAVALDEALYGWAALLARLDGVVWAAASGAGDAAAEGQLQRPGPASAIASPDPGRPPGSCGFVPPAPRPGPSPPPRPRASAAASTAAGSPQGSARGRGRAAGQQRSGAARAGKGRAARRGAGAEEA